MVVYLNCQTSNIMNDFYFEIEGSSVIVDLQLVQVSYDLNEIESYMKKIFGLDTDQFQYLSREQQNDVLLEAVQFGNLKPFKMEAKCAE